MASERTDFQQILEIAGPELAAKLCKQFGGTHVYIPQERTMTKKFRETAIKRDRDAGMSYRDIARKWSMTKGGVYKLVKRVEGAVEEQDSSRRKSYL